MLKSAQLLTLLFLPVTFLVMISRTSEGEILTSIILEVFRVNGDLISAGNQLTKEFGLSSARWQVMGAMHQEKRPLTVAQIARRMGLTRQGVQRVVNDLIELNMVEFKDNLDHKKSKLVDITERGNETLKKVYQVQAKWVNALADGYDVGDLSKALEVLNTFKEKLNKKE